jgi:hypothetical protein
MTVRGEITLDNLVREDEAGEADPNLINRTSRNGALSERWYVRADGTRVELSKRLNARRGNKSI